MCFVLDICYVHTHLNVHDTSPLEIGFPSVRSGQKFADQIEILEGVDQGARVVVRGFLGLREGMKVKVVERG